MFQFSSLLALVLVARLVAAGPCDIYASGGTPCVAAHSTTRALFSAYTGSLYQVKRGSDGATTNIAPLSAGGVANAAAQDSFCASTTCVITIIYDQTGRSNHLTQAPPGGRRPRLAAADGAPVTLNGQKAYGVFISPGSGYRNDATNGIAVGDAAEGMYAVLDGTHFNGGCCFDYGNAEVSADDTGNGHMEAIYFGTGTGFGTGAGSGPWRFVTGVVKGEPGNQWAVRGGNAQSGALSTFYSGVRPSNGYNPMSKEGAIILGIGGDNSDSSQGTFYEGAMTSGYPSDATENSVQANIVAAKYATTSLTSGPALTVGSAVSFRATTGVVTSSDTNALKLSASWNVVAGLANSACVSFESRDTPGSFIRHSGFELFVNANDGSKLFHEDATYCPQKGLNGQGNSIRSNGGPDTFDATASYNDDVSFVVSAAFA
ncbi:alpha-L-arabinofuranosidase [Mycena leptocephala]|nr:alpha-L-arabinofuranosidase [Mycena leptocephala]